MVEFVHPLETRLKLAPTLSECEEASRGGNQSFILVHHSHLIGMLAVDDKLCNKTQWWLVYDSYRAAQADQAAWHRAVLGQWEGGDLITWSSIVI